MAAGYNNIGLRRKRKLAEGTDGAGYNRDGNEQGRPNVVQKPDESMVSPICSGEPRIHVAVALRLEELKS